MEIVNVNIEDLEPAIYNPRQMTKKQMLDLTESIKRFGLVDLIIVNSNPMRKNIIIGGHQRVNVARSLGFTEVPVYYIDLDEEGERELNVRLNKNLGEWNWDILASFNIDFLKNVGFEEKELKINFGLDDIYTKKIVPPVYTPSGNLPDVKDIYDDEKTKSLIAMVEKLEVSDEVKKFLLSACNRFTVFNYSKIADYYANCDNKEVKDLMEKLALVIIDFDKAIEYGFVKASNEIFNLLEKE